ncbi:MAG TPA: hypothetical protein VOA87_11505 [Thermoanaerobaculia bacterium]|nr:hypothetical protein [Thermoanaerobaculia bacterium]
MKRAILVVACILCAFAVGASADPAPPGPQPLPAFLSSLKACAPAAAASRALPKPVFAANRDPGNRDRGDGHGKVQPKATCTSTNACPLTGQPLTCTGSYCSAGDYWVSCDGVYQQCAPLCSEDRICCDGSEIYCEGYVSCSAGPRRITCDGYTDYCPPPSQCYF